MSKCVLVVDEEKNIRMTLDKCLRAQDYKVELAEDAFEALDKVQYNKYDLILIDLKMRGLTGMQVLEKMRNMGKEVNVIMMTEYDECIEGTFEAMDLGVIDFISKPFTSDAIKECIKNVFKREELNDDNIQGFKDLVEYSKKCIIQKEYIKAQKCLKTALCKNVISPEVYNLLGVLEEYLGEIQMAQRYYKAAITMEPSYTPALNNIERISQFAYTQ